ncbi:MAG: hypothetical protein AB1497_00635 [Bacillota bacterium]
MLLNCRSHARLSHLAVLESSALAKLWVLGLSQPYRFSCPATLPWVDLLISTPLTSCVLSLILMTDQKVSSITQWVRTLRNDRVLASLSGFDPEKTPSIGTFYDFMDRLWQEDLSKVRARRSNLRPLRRKPRKARSGKKFFPKHPGVVRKLVDKALKGRSFTRRPERLIQESFARCSVDQSISLGLIPTSLTLSGDGTSLRTGTNPYGVKVCDYHKRGICRCSCPRRYPDPDATWGWDSYRGSLRLPGTTPCLASSRSPSSGNSIRISKSPRPSGTQPMTPMTPTACTTSRT